MRIFLLCYPLACLLLFTGLQQDPALAESMERGRSVFEEFCVVCHQAGGQGVEGVYPPLAGSDYLLQQRVPSIRGVKYGQRGPMVVNGVTYDNTMMPLGLSEQEIADVMNFVRNSWGNQAEGPMVTPEEVASIGPR
jgi:mono/diheme cytochrome c family protein